MEYCLEQQLDTQCNNDEMIVVESARYGRMRLNRCVHTDYGFIGCGTDVTDILAGKCSGRHRCRVVNIEALFAGSRVCPTDLKSYLEATFNCIKGRNFYFRQILCQQLNVFSTVKQMKYDVCLKNIEVVGIYTTTIDLTYGDKCTFSLVLSVSGCLL